MKLETQVCSLELAKRLKELGVKGESLFYWWKFEDISGRKHMKIAYADDDYSSAKDSQCYSAFTVAELGEMLPNTVKGYKWIEVGRRDGQHVVQYQKVDNELQPIRKEADTEANARAKMLIYLLENKLINLNNKQK